MSQHRGSLVSYLEIPELSRPHRGVWWLGALGVSLIAQNRTSRGPSLLSKFLLSAGLHEATFNGQFQYDQTRPPKFWQLRNVVLDRSRERVRRVTDAVLCAMRQDRECQSVHAPRSVPDSHLTRVDSMDRLTSPPLLTRFVFARRGRLLLLLATQTIRIGACLLGGLLSRGGRHECCWLGF